MSFNAGVIVAINLFPRRGGRFILRSITGGHSGVAQRAVVQIGSVVNSGYLALFNEQDESISYPVVKSFDYRGVASIPFKWDASAIPQTHSNTPTGQVASNFNYEVSIQGDNQRGQGNLLWFSNINNVNQLSQHVKIPQTHIRSLDSILSQAADRARIFYGVMNSMSRPALGALVFIK